MTAHLTLFSAASTSASITSTTVGALTLQASQLYCFILWPIIISKFWYVLDSIRLVTEAVVKVGSGKSLFKINIKKEF